MTGEVDERGTPILRLDLAGQEWVAVIDTGFDGFLLLPESLATHFSPRFEATMEVILGDGHLVWEDVFTIDFPFDSAIRPLLASFAPVEELLIGTGLLSDYRLEIDFVARTVLIEKVPGK